MDGVGAAGKNNDARLEVDYGFERRSAGDAERENGEASDSASDEMSILGAKV